MCRVDQVSHIPFGWEAEQSLKLWSWDVKNQHLFCHWNFSESQILNVYSFCHCQQQPSDSLPVSALPHCGLRDLADFTAWPKRFFVIWLLCPFQPRLPRVSNADTLWCVNPEAPGVGPAWPVEPCPFADAPLSAWNPSSFPTGHLEGAYSILKLQLRHLSFCRPSRHMHLLNIRMKKKMSELVNEWAGCC